jgi:hypothetical protein
VSQVLVIGVGHKFVAVAQPFHSRVYRTLTAALWLFTALLTRACHNWSEG